MIITIIMIMLRIEQCFIRACCGLTAPCLRYECVALQEDGEEATTSVDVIVLFAPVVEQEEAYVRRRDGGREVRARNDGIVVQTQLLSEVVILQVEITLRI